MIIIGCDFHTRFQQIAMLDPTTGEIVERRLEHETGEAEKFYASLPGPARVGIRQRYPERVPLFTRIHQKRKNGGEGGIRTHG